VNGLFSENRSRSEKATTRRCSLRAIAERD
jgi:hypothetical protein